MKIYTLGYSGWRPEAVRAQAETLDAVVVDVRWSPRSRNPQWTRKRLTELLGARYRHVKAFGNLNYKGGPIKLANPEAGLAEIRPILEAGQPVILMCVCKEVERCHRQDVAAYLVAHLGEDVVVKHLTPPPPPPDPQLRLTW